MMKAHHLKFDLERFTKECDSPIEIIVYSPRYRRYFSVKACDFRQNKMILILDAEVNETPFEESLDGMSA